MGRSSASVGMERSTRSVTAYSLRLSRSAAASFSLYAAAVMPMISTEAGRPGKGSGSRACCRRNLFRWMSSRVSYAANSHQQAMPQYALSYAAIGALATGASVVNGRRRGMLADLALIPQTLLRARPVSVVIDGRLTRADSLSWHIVPTIAKVFRVSANSRRADGLMEVDLVPHRWWPTAARMSWFGLRALVWPHRQSHSARMTFSWEQGGDAQLDGETVDIPPGSDVTVRCVPAALRMLCCDIDASTKTRSSTVDARAPS